MNRLEIVNFSSIHTIQKQIEDMKFDDKDKKILAAGALTTAAVASPIGNIIPGSDALENEIKRIKTTADKSASKLMNSTIIENGKVSLGAEGEKELKKFTEDSLKKTFPKINQNILKKQSDKMVEGIKKNAIDDLAERSTIARGVREGAEGKISQLMKIRNLKLAAIPAVATLGYLGLKKYKEAKNSEPRYVQLNRNIDREADLEMLKNYKSDMEYLDQK